MTDTTEQTYPIGSVWNHKTYGTEEFTIVGYGDGADVLVTYGNGSGPHPWPSQALDAFGTLVRNAPTTVQEDTMTTTARPTVDFSGDSRATAREYAKAANSRVLKPEHQTRLGNAADGQEVDAYDLNAALTEAMSSCATRLGQSMARRELTKKVRYLAHITQAVLENHADSLPAYDTGERSRLLEEVKPALTDARRTVERLTARVAELQAERTLLTQAAKDERERLTNHVAELKALRGCDAEEIVETRKALRETAGERERIGAVLAYALERLGDVEAQRVFGYWDGLKSVD